MTDIVERLRMRCGHGKEALDYASMRMEEAADEIDRLRAALKEIAGLEYDHVAMVDIARIALEKKP
jgi:hypothetical protein